MCHYGQVICRTQNDPAEDSTLASITASHISREFQDSQPKSMFLSAQRAAFRSPSPTALSQHPAVSTDVAYQIDQQPPWPQPSAAPRLPDFQLTGRPYHLHTENFGSRSWLDDTAARSAPQALVFKWDWLRWRALSSVGLTGGCSGFLRGSKWRCRTYLPIYLP